jgi:asparagine synthase (glutamine-hydrolysing)
VCGVSAIFNNSGLSIRQLRTMNEIVSHRGPDDEGYMTWAPHTGIQVFAGRNTAPSTLDTHQLLLLDDNYVDWKVGFGHKRLSILDVSPAGHQPMALMNKELVITYNGEIYNYVEIKNELLELGHQFETESDTEVILHAWSEWGVSAISRFNGMFAFILLDQRSNSLYAVRDRFGVKPLYYYENNVALAFASEVKQLCTLQGYSFRLNKQIVFDYLSQSLLDHDTNTFEEHIFQVKQGHFIQVDLISGRRLEKQWYELRPKPFEGSLHEAFEQFYLMLKDSVRLRMRSDVPIGSALSGGLDSSTIVTLMREVLNESGQSDHVIKTITSCNKDKAYDEWEYASEIVSHVNAIPFRVYPTFDKLLSDLDRMIWHMDYPFSSTSQFSQWCVFEEAKKRGLTVMIDGQGADEQLAGYGGNDMALYTGLMRKGRWIEWWKEASSYRSSKGLWPKGFMVGSIKRAFQVHGKNSEIKRLPNWLNPRETNSRIFNFSDLQSHLVNQIRFSPLPSLLRYEDRNSMAFSVESRVPFMDYRLIEFTLGLDERVIYRNGIRKFVLRNALRAHVPDVVLNRTDKMGFVSAEEKWLKEEGREWFTNELADCIDSTGEFVANRRSIEMLKRMQQGQIPFNFDPWRIICFNRWYKLKLGR